MGPIELGVFAIQGLAILAIVGYYAAIEIQDTRIFRRRSRISEIRDAVLWQTLEYLDEDTAQRWESTRIQPDRIAALVAAGIAPEAATTSQVAQYSDTDLAAMAALRPCQAKTRPPFLYPH